MSTRKLVALLVSGLLFAAGCSERESTTPTAPATVVFSHNSCSLGVSDATALATIAALVTDVDALETAGSLTSGEANALRNHLNNAARQISAGQYCAAIAQLEAFGQQTGNLVNNGKLTPSEAETLTDGATLVVHGPPQVTVNAPSSAAGVYAAGAAEFGPKLTAVGVSGTLELVNDGVIPDPWGGTGTTSDGCSSLVGFTSGSIAIILRGGCLFIDKVKNAQDAGAIAVIVYNNVSGGPAMELGGTDATITIPSVGISNADGTTILAGLPATGKVSLTQ